MTVPSFHRFAVADWSGAKGSAHPGIALAVCEVGDAAPQLVPPPGRYWSRMAIFDWVVLQGPGLLIGFDFSFAPPFVARGAYLPGDLTPDNARDFRAYVDQRCDDADLGAASFLEVHHRRHFYFGAADGTKSDYMHLRACEAHYNAGGGGKPSSIYDAIGAAQVAKASFAGMRLLNRFGDRAAIWPHDPPDSARPTIVEIYTRIAARAAGLPKNRTKIRDAAELDAALAQVASRTHVPLARYSDHATDAILTAAWLRANAKTGALWTPPAMTLQIAATEGWTFGVV